MIVSKIGLCNEIPSFLYPPTLDVLQFSVCTLLFNNKQRQPYCSVKIKKGKFTSTISDNYVLIHFLIGGIIT